MGIVDEHGDEIDRLHDPFLRADSMVDRTSRHLPHWQLDGGFYFVTWRLADALPQSRLRAWMEERREWLAKHPKPWDSTMREEYRTRFPKRIDSWLDAGYGQCVLRRAENRQVLAEALLYFDGERYDMASFVLMPNHVHTLFQLRGGTTVNKVTHSWKRYSARHINAQLGRQGALWQQENWDRILRGIPDLIRCLSYVRNNPRMAGLSGDAYTYYEAPSLPDALKDL